MGTKLTKNASTRQKLPTIIEDLLKNAPLYDFIAAVRLIRAWLVAEQLPVAWPQLKFVAHLSLAFSTAEIHAITRSASNHFVIYANFLTIYGTASPLPNYYTEDLLSSNNQDNSVVREFLNLFQHRFYQKYFDQYLNIQLDAHSTEANDYTHQIYSLAGLGNRSLIPTVPQQRLLRYAGALSLRLRTYPNLLKLLSDYTDISLTLDPHFRMKRSIAAVQQALLGQKNCSLGENCHLGQHYHSIKTSIKINFLNLNDGQFKRLLPGQDLALEVKELIQFYVLQTINVHIELQLHHTAKLPTAFNNNPTTRLGMGSWLGHSNKASQLNLTYQLM